MSIYDEEFLTIKQAAKHLRLSSLQVRTAVDIDPETGHPSQDSSFPHAYKATPGRTSPVRIPRRDIDAFKRTQAGVRDDDHYIYDEPFMSLSAAAKELRLSMYQMRTILRFEPNDARPQEGSAFPRAYKETPAVNSTIRIPLADIEAYKAERVGGPGVGKGIPDSGSWEMFDGRDGRVNGNIPAEIADDETEQVVAA